MLQLNYQRGCRFKGPFLFAIPLLYVYPYLFWGPEIGCVWSNKRKHPNITMLGSYGGISIMCLSPAWNAIRGITITHKNSRRQWFAFGFYARRLCLPNLSHGCLRVREQKQQTEPAFPLIGSSLNLLETVQSHVIELFIYAYFLSGTKVCCIVWGPNNKTRECGQFH